jgi:putative ABC transport system permease protein
MRLALAEIRRAKLRFGLLTGAIGLLVFLILFQQTLAATLIGSFTAGLENQSAAVLVFSTDARGSVDRSIITPGQLAQVSEVPGVAVAAPLGQATFTAEAGPDAAPTDTTVFGYELGGPGAPTTLSEGRLPETAGEAVASDVDASKGYGIGDSIRFVPGDVRIEIVGLATDAQFNVQPTIYTSNEAYEGLVRAANPDAELVLPTLVAVQPDPGFAPSDVAQAIDDQVDDVNAADRATAAANLPGVDSITQSFAVILLLAFTVVVLVTWVFFLILTVQKTQTLTLMRAVGASNGYLLKNLALQVTLVTVAGVGLAACLLVIASATSGTSLSISADPRLVLTTGGSILALALLASVGAMRRVVRLDPAAATQRQAGGGLE